MDREADNLLLPEDIPQLRLSEERCPGLTCHLQEADIVLHMEEVFQSPEGRLSVLSMTSEAT